MRGGLSNAIQSQSNNLDRFRSKFRKFNERITLGGMSFEESIRLLEADLGPASHEFLRAALNYEKKGTIATLKIFEDIVRFNGSIEEINALQRRRFANHSEDINKMVLAVGVIFLFLVLDARTIEVMRTWYGQLITGAAILWLELLIAKVEILKEPLFVGRDSEEAEVI